MNSAINRYVITLNKGGRMVKRFAKGAKLNEVVNDILSIEQTDFSSVKTIVINPLKQ